MTTASGRGADHVQVRTSEFKSGETIFSQGEPGDRVYLIVEGAVKISYRGPAGRCSLRAIIGPADIFGELAVFDPGPRACTATAITDVRAMSLDRAALRALMAQQPAIAEQLLRTMTRQVQHSERQLVELVSSDVTARVARQLLVLGERFGTREGDVLRLALELSQDEMAQLVGADRVSVNRALRNFATRGWILLEGKTVVIINPKALARRAEAGARSGPGPNRRRRPLRATA
ncbi:Crp/Fnr family transcriptional regulator [Mycobacterium mantenii]|uniref:Crp/Fnr family transcriptional regulator n=1 Tax=Mycobacterium mantenii TaxID=560555 RepID=A0ABM7JXM9_MYCNT|nr:Crp/Fnr family transcriptional regulator [Mycobacterium mantenii]MCV7241302.1 Crp/Fnr family transcriptional regulator [Mycobacterium mantenii]BBY40339.1 Crp/Fnr family transcriptional regulator [Mycobacterium mantenii]